MVIELNGEQRRILSQLVETRLSALSTEIRHTDRASLREELREEREILRGLSGALVAEVVGA